MIAIVSNDPRECAAFAKLCESRGWAVAEFNSVRTFKRSLREVMPAIVVLRRKLADGYSDDVIAALHALESAATTKIVVLIEAGSPPAQEARQVELGADCVQRDPVRADVLLAYLARFKLKQASAETTKKSHALPSFEFAGATIFPLDRRTVHGGREIVLTPREIELAERLSERSGDVVTYATLYQEILGRRFGGDTSNMRVLLGILGASFRKLGIRIREHIAVIPKSGYRYIQPTEAPKNLAPVPRHVRI
jgi:DNA-binding response OmpR family regulator